MRYIASGSRQWKSGRGYEKAPLVNADTLGVPGTLVQVLRVAPMEKIPAHYHEHATEVFHMLSGSGTMTIAGEKVVLSPGDTLVCEAKELHDAENPGKEEWSYIVFKTNWVDGDSTWL
jgi:mannose-6-phosphate isomerase-like protein (cupin superfamily)